MDLKTLHDLAAERGAAWSDAGVDWRVEDGPVTAKPASWLVLESRSQIGQLTLWVSGEAETTWGTPEVGGQRRYAVTTVDELRAAVRDLEAAVTQR